MHADRTNRTAIAVFGLLIFLAGAAGLTTSIGGFGKAYAHRTLPANPVSRYIGTHGDWLWPAVAAACFLIALLALRWIILLLLSTDRAGDITIAHGGRQGDTIMHPAALGGAVAREIDTYHGVDTARARVLGDPGDPALVVTVTAINTADLTVLRHRIESEALSHARHALAKPGLPVQLDIDISHRTPERAS
jgi:hypothetical protein